MYWLENSGNLVKIGAAHLIRRRLASMLIIFGIMALGLGGCGQTDNTASTANDGELIIGLTDAEGDFMSYTVDVLSISMTKANGEEVETMPLTTRLDFAQYTEMTEFLTAATVPSGVYTKATMSVDYRNSDIWVEDANGEGVKVNNIVDLNGNPITTIDLSVRLEGKNKLRIVPGVPAHLTLDFDLNASNKIVFDPNSGEPTQTVAPFLLADVSLENPKIHRLRGPLVSVNVDQGGFKVIMRPFRHRQINDTRFGSLNVLTNSDTVYDINQQDFVGQDGLLELDTLPKFTAMVIIGDLQPRRHRFIAREVYAGSSVAGGDTDVVKGTVIGRDATSLQIKGATLIRAQGSVIFNDTISVALGDDTIYKRQLSTDNFQNQDVSVGQRVTVFGAVNDNSISNLAIDASQGLVRMQLSTLSGSAIAGMDNDPVSPLILALQKINQRPLALFDFSGTGVDAANDANPNEYEISKFDLNLLSIADNAPLMVRGFVTPWESAPNDFDAYSVVDLTLVRAALGINWQPATAVPFTEISAQSLIPNLQGTGLFHHLSRAGVATDLNAFASTPIIEPAADGEGFYVISEAGIVQLHTDFAQFVSDLNARLETGSLVNHVKAAGKFDNETMVLTSRRIKISFGQDNLVQ